MSVKLYVGGLNYKTTIDILREGFEKYGAIEDAVVISDRESGNKIFLKFFYF